MTLKIAIVDDDEMFRQKIENTIRENIQGKFILKTYSRPENLLNDEVLQGTCTIAPFGVWVLEHR